MEIRVKKLVPEAKLPVRATLGSSCLDIYSVERKLFSPMERHIVHTGIAVELPISWGLDLRPRSGLASRGLAILNSPGTIDQDYRGEILVSCINLTSGNILVSKGDRIAQIRPFLVTPVVLIEVKELSETERGEGGFGSTGK